MRKTQNFMDAFLEYTDNTEPPALYKRWVGVGIVAAALRRHVWLNWGGNIYPNQYILLVGKPSVRKGTALRLGREILDAVEGVPAFWGAASIQAIVDNLQEVEQHVPELAPHVPIDLPHANQCSLLAAAEEFPSLFVGDTETFVFRLCELYDSHDRWSYRTIGRGTQHLLGVCLTLLGGTTLEGLQECLPKSAIGGGLTSRMILVHADAKDKLIADPRISDKDRKLRHSLQHDLTAINHLRGPFTASPEWVARYIPFYHDQEENPPFEHRKLVHYLGRRQIHVIKLSMAFSVARGDDLTLTEEDFDKALNLLIATEANMHKCFQGVGGNDITRMGPIVLDRIAQLKEVPFITLFQHFEDDVAVKDFKDLLASLAATKAIAFDRRVGPGGKPMVWLRYTPEDYKQYAQERQQRKEKRAAGE